MHQPPVATQIWSASARRRWGISAWAKSLLMRRSAAMLVNRKGGQCAAINTLQQGIRARSAARNKRPPARHAGGFGLLPNLRRRENAAAVVLQAP
jgi:hypothetical protein